MAGLLSVALENGNAGQPPKSPRPAVVRRSRRTGRWLWRCQPGGRSSARSGVAATWSGAMQMLRETWAVWQAVDDK